MIKLIRITTVPISLRLLLKGQLKFMSEHFEVIAISSPGELLDEVGKEEGVRVIGVPIERKPNPLKDLVSIYRLYKIFKQEKPDIVHTHTPKAGMVGMMAAYLAKVPIRLHTVAGLPLMTRTGIMKTVLVFIEKLTYKFANKIYPNSKGLKQYIESLKIVHPDKLKVIGHGSSNGIDLEYFDPSIVQDREINQIKNDLKFDENDFIFIAIGRIVKDKGINELASAMNALTEKYSNIKLLLLGRFENDLDTISVASRDFLLNSPNVIIPGYQTDIRAYLKLADVFVHPSYREGFPNVVMQACAFNKPVIVTDINGSNEVIKNEINGLIVPVANTCALKSAMEILYLNEEKRMQISNKNRIIMQEKYSQSFVWKQMYNEYKSQIKEQNR